MRQPKLKKCVKEAWVKALRSGKYKQARGRLRNQRGGYCCLGVLCDLSQKELNISWRKCGFNERQFHFGGAFGTLPASVQKWAFTAKSYAYCDISNPVSKREDTKLSNLNDHLKLTFRQIAKIIERDF